MSAQLRVLRWCAWLCVQADCGFNAAVDGPPAGNPDGTCLSGLLLRSTAGVSALFGLLPRGIVRVSALSCSLPRGTARANAPGWARCRVPANRRQPRDESIYPCGFCGLAAYTPRSQRVTQPLHHFWRAPMTVELPFDLVPSDYAT